MTIADWLMIAAVFMGPIVAVQLTRYVDDQREIRSRKIAIFKTLMATRQYNAAWNHVEALNRIDLEFDKDNRKEKEVLDAWKQYLDLLSNTAIPEDQWNVRRVDLLVELLYKMANVLNYDFDKTHIKNSSYSPVAHSDTDREQQALRKGLVEVLEGKRAIPMQFLTPPTNTDQ